MNLKIPQLAIFNKGIVMLVMSNSKYAERVLIQIVTIPIYKAMNLLTETELKNLDKKWDRGEYPNFWPAKWPKQKGKYLPCSLLKGT